MMKNSKINYDIPLTNYDIDDLVKRLKINNFKGCFMRDALPTLKKNESIIINLDDSDNAGSHWVALISIGKKLQYFDSFGVYPPDEIKSKYKKKVMFSTMQVQDINSNRCGWYCLYFLNEISKGIDYFDLIYLYDIHNKNKNEKQLKNYFIKRI